MKYGSTIYDTCGTTRPGTLGYQRCIRVKNHGGKHKSQDGQQWPRATGGVKA